MATGLANRADGEKQVGAQSGFGSRQQKRARDRAGTEDSEQHAVKVRAAADLLARHEWQQRPIGAGEQEKTGGADERRPQVLVVPGVAQAGQDRLAEALR